MPPAEQAMVNSAAKRVTRAPAIVSCAFLLLAVFARWPYGFYTLLRFAVCGSAAYLAVQAYELKKHAWVWVMGSIAVLFNPFIPVHLRRSDWQVIDFIVAVVFAVSLATIRPRGR